MIDHLVYQSPFSWRYGSAEMRAIWSDTAKRRLWRSIWVSLARVEAQYGLVTGEQVAELEAHTDDVDISRALEIEADIRHDLMAEVRTFAEQCPIAGGIIHLGATSMDIEDNADAIRMRDALRILAGKVDRLLMSMADRIDELSDIPIMAFTHIQPAEPTTLGYRLAMWAQDLLDDRTRIVRELKNIRGKGFKGAVGSQASYSELVGENNVVEFERKLSEALDLDFFPIATQTYPRKQDYSIISVLGGLGASLHKFALDLRILQSPPIGEISEPFTSKQVGSSAMPFKRNPINAEKINSLSRSLSVMPQVAWQNAAQSILERTLDDSANRRTMLPEAFLICDEIVMTAQKIVDGLVVNRDSIRQTMDSYVPFANTEALMMEMVKAGADRQETHEQLRGHALAAWARVQAGSTDNPLAELIAVDPYFATRIGGDRARKILARRDYVGTSPSRARALSAIIRQTLAGTSG